MHINRVYLLIAVFFTHMYIINTMELEVKPAIVRASIGEEVILGCFINHPIENFDLRYTVIEWTRLVGNASKTIYALEYGEHESFRPGAVISNVYSLKGNVSLHLINITVQDSGKYTCSVTLPRDKANGSVILTVMLLQSELPTLRHHLPFILACVLISVAAGVLWYFTRNVSPVVSDIIKSSNFTKDEPISLTCAVVSFKPKAIAVAWYHAVGNDFQRNLIIEWSSTAKNEEMKCMDRTLSTVEESKGTTYIKAGNYEITFSLLTHRRTYTLISQLTVQPENSRKSIKFFFEVHHKAFRKTVCRFITLEYQDIPEVSSYFPAYMMKQDRWAVDAIEGGRRTLVNYISCKILPLLDLLVSEGIISKEDHYAVVSVESDIDKGRTLLDTLSHKGQNICAQFFAVLPRTEDLYPNISAYTKQLCQSYLENDRLHTLQKEFPVMQSTFPSTVCSASVYISDTGLHRSICEQRAFLKCEVESLKQYFAFHDSKRMLNDYFTNLVILNVNERNSTEHELLQRRDYSTCHSIELKQLLSPSGLGAKPPRATLVQGVAGIGKTVMIQKLVHSWASEEMYEQYNVLLYFSFRLLNEIKIKVSLVQLVEENYPHFRKQCRIMFGNKLNILFIFDGMDEFQLQFEFDAPSVTDPDVPQQLNHLVINLLKGSLLPEASVLITSRPSAIGLENRACFDRCAEILGFSRHDISKYFEICLKDKALAGRVFENVIAVDSLYGLCYIPAFCDILCFYIKKSNQQQSNTFNVSCFPRTLTDLFLRFTKCLMIDDNEKDCSSFDFQEDDLYKQELLMLAEVAWDGVLNKKLIFADESFTKDAASSKRHGRSLWKKILTSECLKTVKHQIWQFIHLTHQEFFAAVFCLFDKQSRKDNIVKVFESKCGDFEIVVRFASGLVSSGNKALVEELLPKHYGPWEEEIFNSIKASALTKIQKEDTVTPEIIESCTADKRHKLTAFHCLYEAADKKLARSVAEQLGGSINFSYITLNASDCVAIANMFALTSGFDIVELDGCKMGPIGFQRVEHVLTRIRTLSIEGNQLGDEGAKIIANILQKTDCQIEILRLKQNLIEAEGGVYIADALKTNTSLKTLGLRANCVGAAGARSMAEALQENSTLRVLGLQFNKIGDEGAHCIAKAMEKNNGLIELRLGDNGITERGSDNFISSLQLNKTLEELWILVNPISSDGKERLMNIKEYNQTLRLY